MQLLIVSLLSVFAGYLLATLSLSIILVVAISFFHGFFVGSYSKGNLKSGLTGLAVFIIFSSIFTSFKALSTPNSFYFNYQENWFLLAVLGELAILMFWLPVVISAFFIGKVLSKRHR